MVQKILLVALTLAISLGGGAASVWYALQAEYGFGTVTVGAWTAHPEIGSPNADPYSKAILAREGVLALGLAEGIVFVAQRDSSGEALRRECHYQLTGAMPPARFWTLYAADQTLSVLAPTGRRAPALHSLELLRSPGQGMTISASNRPAAGNWLAISGSGPLSLVLSFYDTPISTSTGLENITLPSITKAGCDA
jgi:hypothetical protein